MAGALLLEEAEELVAGGADELLALFEHAADKAMSAMAGTAAAALLLIFMVCPSLRWRLFSLFDYVLPGRPSAGPESAASGVVQVLLAEAHWGLAVSEALG